MKSVYLDWHLRMGDSIICNGLVRVLARTCELHVPVYPHNRPTVAWMFSDLENVHLFDVTGPDLALVSKHCDETLSIGIHNPEWGSVTPFDRAFYRHAGVDFSARWDEFFCPVSDTEMPVYSPGLCDVCGKFECVSDKRTASCPKCGRMCPLDSPAPYILIHDDRSRGYEIDGLKAHWNMLAPRFVQPGATLRITDWRPVIAAATEIHCIDSSFLHLVESVHTSGKLFFHQYARPAATAFDDAIKRKEWTVVK